MRPAARLLLLACSGLLAASAAPAQTVGDLALQWIQGDFRSPIVCEIDGVPRRALRRVRITPSPRTSHRHMDRLIFHDLEAPPGTRCHDTLGTDEPNLVGALVLIHEGRKDRPDLANHEFSDALRREGGFEFAIASGTLRIGALDVPEKPLRAISFKGGTASVRSVQRGTDAYRRLAEYGARRKLLLELAAPDGTKLEFDLVQLEPL